MLCTLQQQQQQRQQQQQQQRQQQQQQRCEYALWKASETAAGGRGQYLQCILSWQAPD
jgi:cysteinyl-tRNA synthetase